MKSVAIKRFVYMAAAVALLCGGWWLAKACAPDFVIAVFSYHRHPDLPRTAFIDGRLGVLQPTFARSYLVVAYRYLNGIGLNPREREQARDYYKDRETGSWDHTGTDWVAQWRAVRSRINSPAPPSTRLITGGTLAYDPETHSFYLNCAEDAFRVAIHTLDARRAQFGYASAAFVSWLAAQDKVFANCEGGAAAIPSQAAPDLPPLILADRSYQIAAANFYAGNYQAAANGFRSISQDHSSPWNAISYYLVVRTLLRNTPEGKPSGELEAQAKKILADGRLASIHGMTWNLIQRAGIRERDQGYLRELALLLASKGQDNGFREELWNYTDLYDNLIREGDAKGIKPTPTDSSRSGGADLTDWLLSFQSRSLSTFPHSLARWKETRSIAWLLAALSHATVAQARREDLLRVAAAIPATSPAYLTAQFHLQRLNQQQGEQPETRRSIQALLASPLLNGLPSSVNLFRGLQMLSAPDLEEFLRFALRKPVMITFDTNVAEAPEEYPGRVIPKVDVATAGLDGDATSVLNKETPFRLLKEAGLSDSLPPHVQREALIVAFARGLMLDQDLAEIAARLSTHAPDIQDLANAYLRESGPDGRRFAAAFLLLRRPEARPYFGSGVTRQTPPGKLDNFRDNWWCPVDLQAKLDSRANTDSWPASSVLPNSAGKIGPAFLNAESSAEARRELAKLGTLSTATDFLSGIVFSYAASHADDPRIPEALHNLVRSGHYGCADVNTWKVTRAAFRMLHLRYPASDWTKRTPTWFKNDYDVPRATPSQ